MINNTPAAKPSRRTNAEHTAETIASLLAVSRDLFTSKGFAATSIEDIVHAAGLTRGALYHHFKGKEALFEALFFQLQREIGERIKQSDKTGLNPWQSLFVGCRAFLSACLEPDVQRIVILDAPGVLGMDVWRAADESNSTYLLRRRLKEMTSQGELVGLNPDVVTSLLNGALNDAALFIAHSPKPKVAFRQVCTAFEQLLNGLRPVRK